LRHVRRVYGAFELTDCRIFLFQIYIGKGEVVVRGGKRGIDLQGFMVQLKRGGRISQFAAHLTQQREEMGNVGLLPDATLQLLSGLLVKTKVDIDAGEVEARPEQIGVEIERLLQLCFSFG